MDRTTDSTRKNSVDSIRQQGSFPFPRPQNRGGSETPTHRNTLGYPFSASGANTPGTPGSIRASTTAFHVPTAGKTKYFRSRRIQDVSTIAKPWTEVKDTKKKYHTIIPMIGIFLGFCLVGLACYQGYTSVINHTYCPIYNVDFTTGGQLDEKIWTKEVQLGGFGYVASL